MFEWVQLLFVQGPGGFLRRVLPVGGGLGGGHLKGDRLVGGGARGLRGDIVGSSLPFPLLSLSIQIRPGSCMCKIQRN